MRTAVSKPSRRDGVHFLCLFDPDKDDALERFIGDCGVHDNDRPSPTGSKTATELLEAARDLGAVCIAAMSPPKADCREGSRDNRESMS